MLRNITIRIKIKYIIFKLEEEGLISLTTEKEKKFCETKVENIFNGKYEIR